jgi:hypothetical protein
MRYTQFAGNHPFCDKHAELETDFGSEDADWENLKMTEVDLTKIQLIWTQDILVRIKTILDSNGWTEDQKLVSIAWLVKQAINPDED